MKFHYNDRVFVKTGFHKGRHGRIVAHVLFQYLVSFNDGDDAGKNDWFWPWQLGHTLRIGGPVDNARTLENHRKALEIVARHKRDNEVTI